MILPMVRSVTRDPEKASCTSRRQVSWLMHPHRAVCLPGDPPVTSPYLPGLFESDPFVKPLKRGTDSAAPHSQ